MTEKRQNLRSTSRPSEYYYALAWVLLPGIVAAVWALLIGIAEMGIMLLVLNAAVLALAMMFLQETVKVYKNAAKLPYQDVSHQYPTPPGNMAAITEALAGLDMAYLGVARVYGQANTQTGGDESVYISGDGIVVATAVAVPAAAMPHYVQFATVFKDGMVLHTEYPKGEFIDQPLFRSDAVSTSIDAAYHVHLRHVAEIEAEQGAPRVFKTMDDWLRWYANFNRQHTQTKLKPTFWRTVYQTATINGMLNGFLAGGLITLEGIKVTSTPYLVYGVAMLGMALVSLFVLRRLRPASVDVRSKKKPVGEEHPK